LLLDEVRIAENEIGESWVVDNFFLFSLTAEHSMT
jgi:hypothetical protein